MPPKREVGFIVGFDIGLVVGFFQGYWYLTFIDDFFYIIPNTTFSDNPYIDFAFRGKFILFVLILCPLLLLLNKSRTFGIGLLISSLISLVHFLFRVPSFLCVVALKYLLIFYTLRRISPYLVASRG